MSSGLKVSAVERGRVAVYFYFPSELHLELGSAVKGKLKYQY